MSRQVLDVGQCNPDHSSISQTLKQNFDVEIQRAHSHDEAIKLARETKFDLILINRILDADGSAGTNILDSLKSDEATKTCPVMLVSNFEEAQDAAVKNGAVHGFGKASLSSPETINALSAYLERK